ncbi:hypothetical protein BH09ACT1_BH09ACT1_10300 [soil metagenome]
MDNPGFITPPPGLIPDAPEQADKSADRIDANTGTSGTHRLAARPSIPAFVPAMPGAAPVAPAEKQSTTPPAAVQPEPIASSTSTPQWSLALHDGSVIHLTGALLLGRDPARLDGWQSADLLTINDPEKTVSKTHAALAIGPGGTLTVVDLDSTNGVGILRAAASNGAAELSVLEPGEPEQIHSGDTLRLGNYAVEITAG